MSLPPSHTDRTRVTRNAEALYSPPRTCGKRRRCDGHLADRHWIEVGDGIVWSALPPGSDIGNQGWWHAAFCLHCAPANAVPSRPVVAIRQDRDDDAGQGGE